MPRVRHYLEENVLSAAKKRIHHIYDTFDSVSVCFSGGKDSLVALHLCKEVAQERGLTQIDALFRDEELIPNTVIDFVDHYRQQPWIKMLWFTVPLESHTFCLGKTAGYIQWDPARPHVRVKPPWGINLPPGDTRVMSQYTMDEYSASFYHGKVALVTGIRASESLIRFRASVNKLNENYLTATSSPQVSLAKPLYDWEENDVFKYFHESGIQYCRQYDQQMWSGRSLRVATPFCSEAAKQLGSSLAADPEFYDRVMTAFPHMRQQARYWKEYDRGKLNAKYGQNGYDGLESYIAAEIEDPEQQKKARKFLAFARNRAASGSGEYSIKDLLRHIVNGQFRRTIMAHTDKFEERRQA